MTTKRRAPKAKPKKSKSEPTTTLTLTLTEMTHFRDLMSCSVASVNEGTVSEIIAKTLNRETLEQGLWDKVAAACREINIPLDEHAPNMVLNIESMPVCTISVEDIENEELESSDDETTLEVWSSRKKSKP